MKHSFQIGGIVLLLCIYLISYADKIDKTGTILNSKCNPIGTRCGSRSADSKAEMTYIYNEPRQGSFSIQFTEDVVLKNDALAEVLVDKKEHELTEEMPIPEDVIEALKMPEDYVVPVGIYPIEFNKGVYKMVFVK
jgi:hypothetical protein